MPRLPPLKRVNAAPRITPRELADEGQATADTVRDMGPHARGTMVAFSFDSAGSASFNHKLGRQPEGWFIADTDSVARVWRNSWDSRTITLQASASVTGKAWVF